jgi:hypothetical protein
LATNGWLMPGAMLRSWAIEHADQNASANKNERGMYTRVRLRLTINFTVAF